MSEARGGGERGGRVDSGFAEEAGGEMSKFSNQLSDAQIERLAILAEELGEAQQMIGKVLRHGYESQNPLAELGTNAHDSNRFNLERELADIAHAIEMMIRGEDVSSARMTARVERKRESIKRWLHHQD